MKPLASPPPRQHGFTLIEALVSLAILALGVLGLAAVQTRMLVETRTTNSRAVAIRLIGELNERIQTNPTGAQPGADPAHSTTVSPYSDTEAASFPDKPDDTANDCSAPPAPPATTSCTSAQQAAYDVATWRQKVADTLMGGKASIWQISPRQLQVVVAWQANENTQPTLNNAAASAATQQVAQEMSITAAGIAANANLCSGTTICHIDFIDIPPAR